MSGLHNQANLAKIDRISQGICSEAETNYSWPFKKEKIAAARESSRLMSEYFKSRPIAWNISDSQESLQKSCRAYVSRNIKPTTFIDGGLGLFFIMSIISGIISWVVQRWLTKWFGN